MVKIQSIGLDGISRLLTTLNDYLGDFSDLDVHLDQCEVWADGNLVGLINIDDDTFVFVPNK